MADVANDLTKSLLIAHMMLRTKSVNNSVVARSNRLLQNETQNTAVVSANIAMSSKRVSTGYSTGVAFEFATKNAMTSTTPF